MREAFICDGIRTPIGRYGGALSGVRADDLAAIPLRELLVRNPRLDAECIDDVILGCANQAGEDNRNVARMATLLAGLPQSVSGTTINRLCGSGLDALGFAARAIKAGDGDLLIAGGVESMSRAPFVMGKATSAFSRQAEMFDTTIGWRFVNPLMCNFAFFSGLIDAQFWAGIAQLKSPELTAKIYLFSSGLSPRPFLAHPLTKNYPVVLSE